MALDPRLRRGATTLAFRVLGEKRFDDLRALHMARKIRTGRYRSPEIDLLPRLIGRGDCAIDVGANFGLYAYHFARIVGERGQVYAFEAVPETSRGLRRVLTTLGVAGRVDVIEKAVGATSGSVTFDLPRRADGSADVGRAGAAATVGDTAAVQRVELPLTRVDDEVPAGADVAFIKVDVEGSDFFVLQGADGVLTRSQPSLLIEISPPLLARHGLSGREIGAFLSERGYATYRYDAGRLAAADPADMAGDLVAVHPRRAAAIESIVAG